MGNAGTEAEIAVGGACAWLVAAALRESPDARAGRLHALVAGALAGDPAMDRAAAEAAGGEVSVRTRRRLTDALDEAVEQDAEVAAALHRLLAGAGEPPGTGDVRVEARDGSAAALRMGDVTIAHPPVPGPPQG
jgi:hypothetical protein